MKEFTIDARLVRAAQVYQAKEDIRYYLNGIFIGKDGQIAGTDGHSLFVSSHSQELDQDYVVALEGKVPTAAFEVHFKILSNEPSSLVLIECRNPLKANYKKKLIGGRLIDGTYPDINKVIPDHSDEKLKKAGKVSRLGFNPGLIGKWTEAFPPRIARNGVVMTFLSEVEALALRPGPGTNLPEDTMAVIMPMRM